MAQIPELYNDKRQPDLFYDANTRFCMVLTSMYSDLWVAEMGLIRFGILTCIRCACALRNGSATMGYRQIAKECGVHKDTVKKHIEFLEENGWLERYQENENDRFTYTLTDKIKLFEVEKSQQPKMKPKKTEVGEFILPYEPRELGGHLSKMRDYLQRGEPHSLKGVPITINLNINFINNTASGAGSTAVVQVNAPSSHTATFDWKQLDGPQKAFLSKMIDANILPTDED